MVPSVCVLEDPRLGRPSLAKHVRSLGFRVEVASGDPAELLARLSARIPQLAIVDATHPSQDRLQALRVLARSYPTVKVVAVVDGVRRAQVARCKALGAWRCVYHSVARSKAMAQVLHKGAKVRNRQFPRLRARGVTLLTPKEREVLEQIATGADNLKIAAVLGIAERTVKVHVTSIYRKLGAQSRVELALLGRGLMA